MRTPTGLRPLVWESDCMGYLERVLFFLEQYGNINYTNHRLFLTRHVIVTVDAILRGTAAA